MPVKTSLENYPYTRVNNILTNVDRNNLLRVSHLLEGTEATYCKPKSTAGDLKDTLELDATYTVYSQFPDGLWQGEQLRLFSRAHLRTRLS